jgi:hypothetical protein
MQRFQCVVVGSLPDRNREFVSLNREFTCRNRELNGEFRCFDWFHGIDPLV